MLNCNGTGSCTYREIHCGTEGNPANCEVVCQWDGDGQSMMLWLDTYNDLPFVDGDYYPLPPCNAGLCFILSFNK